MTEKLEKRGRPPKAEKRKKQFWIYLTDEEYALIRCKAKLHGKDASVWAREVLTK